MRQWCRSCRRCRKCIRGVNRCKKTYSHIRSLSRIRVCALNSSMAPKVKTKNYSDNSKERIQSSRNRWRFFRNKTLFKWHPETTWFRQMLHYQATNKKLWLNYRRINLRQVSLKMGTRFSTTKRWPHPKARHKRRMVTLPINQPPHKSSLQVVPNAQWQSSTSIKLLKNYRNKCSNLLMKSQKLRW